MTTPPIKTLIDEQVEDAQVQVRAVLTYTRSTRVVDIPPMKADWLKRRPVERRV